MKLTTTCNLPNTALPSFTPAALMLLVLALLATLAPAAAWADDKVTDDYQQLKKFLTSLKDDAFYGSYKSETTALLGTLGNYDSLRKDILKKLTDRLKADKKSSDGKAGWTVPCQKAIDLLKKANDILKQAKGKGMDPLEASFPLEWVAFELKQWEHISSTISGYQTFHDKVVELDEEVKKTTKDLEKYTKEITGYAQKVEDAVAPIEDGKDEVQDAQWLTSVMKGFKAARSSFKLIATNVPKFKQQLEEFAGEREGKLIDAEWDRIAAEPVDVDGSGIYANEAKVWADTLKKLNEGYEKTFKSFSDEAEKFQKETYKEKMEHISGRDGSTFVTYRTEISDLLEEKVKDQYDDAVEELTNGIASLKMDTSLDKVVEAFNDGVTKATNQIGTPVIGLDANDLLDLLTDNSSVYDSIIVSEREARSDWNSFLSRMKRPVERKRDQLLERCMTDETKDDFRQKYTELWTDKIEDAKKEHKDGALGDWKKNARLESLKEKVDEIGDFQIKVNTFATKWRNTFGTLARQGSTVNGALDAVPGYITGMSGKLGTIADLINESRFDKVYKEFQGKAKRRGYDLTWTDWELHISDTTAAVLRMATMFMPKMGKTVIRMCQKAATIDRTWANLVNKVKGRDAFADEFIDDPDAFMAMYVTNDIFDVLDSMNFDTLAQCRDRLTPSDFERIFKDELMGLVDDVRAAASKAGAGTSATILKGSAEALEAALLGAFSRGGDALDKTVDAICGSAMRSKQARDRERKEFRAEMEELIEDAEKTLKGYENGYPDQDLLLDDYLDALDDRKLNNDATRDEFEDASKEHRRRIERLVNQIDKLE